MKGNDFHPLHIACKDVEFTYDCGMNVKEHHLVCKPEAIILCNTCTGKHAQDLSSLADISS